MTQERPGRTAPARREHRSVGPHPEGTPTYYYYYYYYYCYCYCYYYYYY